MTLEIIKPNIPLNQQLTSEEIVAGKAALLGGLVDGSITDIHDAVTAVNAVVGPSVNGGIVRPYFKKFVDELKALDAYTDQCARDGMIISEIVTAVTTYIEENNVSFSIADLQTMKVEVYGSVANWISAMTASEEA